MGQIVGLHNKLAIILAVLLHILLRIHLQILFIMGIFNAVCPTHVFRSIHPYFQNFHRGATSGDIIM